MLGFDGDLAAPDGRVLAPGLTLLLGRDEHLRLRGPNGSGKSTLLAALLAGCTLPGDKVLHLPQELTQAATRADLHAVRALAPEPRERVLQLVHALGVEPDRLLRSADPSPGEGRKLRLALGPGRHAWLLALDEPTSHLDLPATQRLEAALREFPGALLLVTHDARLGEAVRARSLALGGGAQQPRLHRSCLPLAVQPPARSPASSQPIAPPLLRGECFWGAPR